MAKVCVVQGDQVQTAQKDKGSSSRTGMESISEVKGHSLDGLWDVRAT